MERSFSICTGLCGNTAAKSWNATFAGFKIKNGIAVAEYQKSIQQYQLENDKQDIALAATQGFVNLYKAKQAINVINENLSDHIREVLTSENWNKTELLPEMI